MLDLHTHVVPPRPPFLPRLTSADPRWARLEPAGETGDVLVSGTVFRTVRRVAWDLHARRAACEAAGGTGQLLSAMPELLAPWAPPDQGLAYARAFNEWLTTEVAAHQGFFTGLGVVPLRDPDAAAALLAEIADAGLLGVEVPSSPPTAPLHAPAWAGFLDEAERLGLLVFVHAVGGPAAADYPHPMAANGVLFPASIGTAIGGLIATGAVAARPGLRLLASHGGGSLLTELPRIDFLRDTTPALAELMPESAGESARRLWYDPLLFDAGLIRHLVGVVGADRIVLGTDHPFMPADPVALLDEASLPAGFATAVRETNPAALLDLLTRRPWQRSWRPMTSELLAPLTTPSGPAAMVDDRPAEGFFRVNRAALVDEEVFAEEQKSIFDRCWLYVGHTSEVANPGDFRARTVAGRPLVLWRGTDGEVRVFLNACRHRGAQLCRIPEGNARGMSCFYHAWTYSNDGRLTGLPDAEGYGPDFDRARFSLTSPPRVETYRGFVFCCFDPDAVTLADYLGEAREYLDLVADQSPEMVVVDGLHEYSMEANWKLFVENSLDGYHLIPLHRTYFDYLKSTEDSYLDPRKPTEARALGNGHAVITVEGPWARPVARWTPAMGEENREYVEAQWVELEKRFDAERARRIAMTDRNLLVFPNLVINDIMGIVIRTITPTSAGRTVISQWTMATKGEPESVRARRLDSYVTFQGPGGLATPDDMEACESCQEGFATAAESPWSDISRGIHKEAAGGPFVASDEIQQRAFWRHWRDLIGAERD